MTKVKITQIRSSIGQTQRQKDTLIALGLRRIGRTTEKDLNPQIQGMINKVAHLVTVKEI